jgi:hypothetical protein
VNYLPGLALNLDPPDLCLLSSWDYRREPLEPSQSKSPPRSPAPEMPETQDGYRCSRQGTEMQKSRCRTGAPCHDVTCDSVLRAPCWCTACVLRW